MSGNVRRGTGQRSVRVIVGLACPVLVLVLWEGLGDAGALPRYLVPPSVIFQAFWAVARDGELLRNTNASLARTVAGFLIGTGCGTFIGLFAGVAPRIEQFFGPVVSLTYPVPKTAFLPIAFAWFGLGDASKIVVIAVSVFYPAYIAAFYGVHSVNKIHVWSALNMGASRATVFFRVIVPSALPQIFNGLRIGLGLSFVVMVVSELITARSGLGYMIGFAQNSSRFDLMYVAILTIGTIGFLADFLLRLVRSRVLVGQLLNRERL